MGGHNYSLEPSTERVVLCDAEDFRVVLTVLGEDLIVCERYIRGIKIPLASNYRSVARAETYINSLLNNGWVMVDG